MSNILGQIPNTNCNTCETYYTMHYPLSIAWLWSGNMYSASLLLVEYCLKNINIILCLPVYFSWYTFDTK